MNFISINTLSGENAIKEGGCSISVYLARIFDRFYYLGDIAIDYN
jgi:hypothetical protein